MNRLRLTEIFFSLQGETSTVGIPTIFIRLTGCPLRCQYCDTTYAFHGGTWHNIPDILAFIKQYKTDYVTVTGGEPLAQKNCLPLLKELCDANYRVSLETSGALSIAEVDGRVSRIVDIKTPGSGEVDRNDWSNMQYLKADDQIKFVICDDKDYQWAKDMMQQYELLNRCTVLFSPCEPQLPPGELADWVVRDQLNVRFQIQLHKFLWGNVPGR